MVGLSALRAHLDGHARWDAKPVEARTAISPLDSEACVRLRLDRDPARAKLAPEQPTADGSRHTELRGRPRPGAMGASRSTSIMALISSSDVSSSRPARTPPALLISTSRPPSRSRAAARVAARPSAVAASVARPCASIPASVSCLTAARRPGPPGGEQQPGALGAECLRGGQADAAGPTCDENALATNVHDDSPMPRPADSWTGTGAALLRRPGPS